MVRGDYTVQEMEGTKPDRQDKSYKSCVVTMFIIFLLCVIVILIIWRVNPGYSDGHSTSGRTGSRNDTYKHTQGSTTMVRTTESPDTTKIQGTTKIKHQTTTLLTTMQETKVPENSTTASTTTPLPTTTTTTTPLLPATTTPTTTPLLPATTTTTTTPLLPATTTTTTTPLLPATTTPTTTPLLPATTTPTTPLLPATTTPITPSPNTTTPTPPPTTTLLTTTTTTTSSTPYFKTSSSDPVSTNTDTLFTISTMNDQVSQGFGRYQVATNGTRVSTTVKQEEITTVVIPVVSNFSIKNETVTNPLEETTLTEIDYSTILSEDPSVITKILSNTEATTLHHLNKTTLGVLAKTTSSATDDETADTETVTTNTPLAGTTTTQIISNLSTIQSTTIGKIHLPLVYTTIPINTTSDDVTNTESTVTEFETTLSETVPYVVNLNIIATTTSDEDNVTSQTATQSNPPVTNDEETTTNAYVSQILVTVTESQNSTSSATATTFDANNSTSTIFTNATETTSHITVTGSQNITTSFHVVSSTTPFIGTTAHVAVTNSQNTTETMDEDTTVPFIVLEGVSESSTTVADQTTKNIANQTCQTSECKVVTSRMLSLMNHTVKPCDNFYEFACGGLRDNHALLQEDPTQDVWSRIAFAVNEVNNRSNPIYQKFRQFYDQCVEYEHTVDHSERLRLARKEVFKVDKLYNNVEWVQANANFNLTDILVKLLQLDSTPLFDVSVDVDHHNPTKFQLKLTVPRVKSKLQLEPHSVSNCKSHIYSEDPNNISIMDVYNNNYLPCVMGNPEYFIILEKAINEMELFDNSTTAYNVSQYISAIKFFIESDVFSLREEVLPWEIRTHILQKKFTLMTVEELAGLYPEIEWQVLFGALMKDAVPRETVVQVYFQNYFDRLFGQFRSSLTNATARLIIHNGLLAMLANDIYTNLVKSRPCDREEYCLRIASGLMEDVSSSLYLSTFTSEELRSKELQLHTLFDQLKNVLSEEINHTTWLNEDSRTSMLKKVENMKVIADGGRSILSDPNYLRNQLNDQDLNASNNYFINAIQLQRRYRNLIYYLVSYSADPTSPEVIWTFFHLPYDTHSIAVYQLNVVIIPYGLIGSWKPTNELPSFVWKARLGNKIARQIVRHFDSTGILYGSNGTKGDLIADSEKDLYDENYVDCELGFDTWPSTWTNQKNQIYHYTVNAARNMYEHFSDNSALWLTHKLLNKSVASEPILPWLDMNHEELYLLLVTQEFCAKAELLDYTVMMFETEQLPPYLRAENMIVNSEEIGYAYKCGIGGKQNRNVKCLPFPQGSNGYVSGAGPIPVA